MNRDWLLTARLCREPTELDDEAARFVSSKQLRHDCDAPSDNNKHKHDKHCNLNAANKRVASVVIIWALPRNALLRVPFVAN